MARFTARASGWTLRAPACLVSRYFRDGLQKRFPECTARSSNDLTMLLGFSTLLFIGGSRWSLDCSASAI